MNCGRPAMKIIHVIDSLEVGGAERIVAHLCRLHRQQGHDPAVCCLMSLGALGGELLGEGFEVDVLQATRTDAAIWRLRAYLRRRQPDVVHAHNLFAIWAACIPARRTGAVVVGTRHGLCAPAGAREIRHALATRCCDWTVAVCDATARNLAATPLAAKQRIVRIYNGAAVSSSGPSSAHPGRFTLVTVGRLDPTKDQATMLAALKIAAARVPDIRLLIVGGGKLEPALHAQAAASGLADCVVFCGEQREVEPFLRTAHVFVLSSVSEGLPLSLLEAMACRLPVIVTSVGGMAEVVERSGCGQVVPPRHPAALAEAIVKYAQHRELLPALRHRSYESFLQHFTVERMASEYMALYGSVARGREPTIALLSHAG